MAGSWAFAEYRKRNITVIVRGTLVVSAACAQRGCSLIDQTKGHSKKILSRLNNAISSVLPEVGVFLLSYFSHWEQKRRLAASLPLWPNITPKSMMSVLLCTIPHELQQFAYSRPGHGYNATA